MSGGLKWWSWDFVFRFPLLYALEIHASGGFGFVSSEISARRGHYVARCRMPASMTHTLTDPLELAASRCYRIQSLSGWRYRIYPFRGIRNTDKFIKRRTHERSTNGKYPEFLVSICKKNHWFTPRLCIATIELIRQRKLFQNDTYLHADQEKHREVQ
jgi:hypothetical protein